MYQIAKCDIYDVARILNTDIWQDFPDVKNKKVFVKPNLVMPPVGPDFWACTHKEVVQAVLIKLQEGGASKIIVGDCGFKDQWDLTIKSSGYDEICKIYDAELICVQEGENFHKYTLKRFENKEDYLSLYGTKISDFVLDSDIVINIPKLKVHSLAGITCAIKNMMGVISPKGSMHPKADPEILHKRLCDLYQLMTPIVNWTLVDGIVGMEYSETFGVNKSADVLISGKDMWEVDSAAAMVMNIPLVEIKYLNYISQKHKEGFWPTSVPETFVTPFEKSLIMRKALCVI